MKSIYRLLLALFLSVMVTGCSQQRPYNSTLYQVSTLQTLMQGGYDGTVTFDKVLKHGDTGIGTFHALDGEMIMLEGNIYQVKSDGKIYPVNKSQTTPFANVAFLDKATIATDSFVDGISNMYARLDSILPRENKPALFLIQGQFNNVTCRSVPGQTKPYPSLKEVAQKQSVFKKDNVAGKIIGFRFPEYLQGVNITGYHMHFLSDDLDFGGHILSIESGEINVQACNLSNISIYLPDQIRNFTSIVSDDDIHAVEKAK